MIHIQIYIYNLFIRFSTRAYDTYINTYMYLNTDTYLQTHIHAVKNEIGGL